MAVNDLVLRVVGQWPSGVNPCVPFNRDGGQNELVEVFSFEPAATRIGDYKCYMSNYAGGDLNLVLGVWTVTGTAGNLDLQAAPRRLNDQGKALDQAHTYVFQNTVTAGPFTIFEPRYITIPFTAAQLDGWSNEEYGIMRIQRVNDTVAGFIDIFGVAGFEA